EALGKYWASLGDVFVNDAFGTAHRSHASNVGISAHLPAVSGFLIEKEIEFLGEARSEEHTYELQSRFDIVCRLLLEKKNYVHYTNVGITITIILIVLKPF